MAMARGVTSPGHRHRSSGVRACRRRRERSQVPPRAVGSRRRRRTLRRRRRDPSRKRAGVMARAARPRAVDRGTRSDQSSRRRVVLATRGVPELGEHEVHVPSPSDGVDHDPHGDLPCSDRYVHPVLATGVSHRKGPARSIDGSLHVSRRSASPRSEMPVGRDLDGGGRRDLLGKAGVSRRPVDPHRELILSSARIDDARGMAGRAGTARIQLLGDRETRLLDGLERLLVRGGYILRGQEGSGG